MNIRNRIIEQRLVTPDEVAPNPRNWRMHPQAQRDAIRGILGQVGIAAPVIAYYSARAGNRLMLIDGHERMTVGVPFPCAILDVDDAEADTLLATFDPITTMATANNEALDALLRDVTTDSPALTQMLAELAEDVGLYADTPTITEDDVPEPPVDPITKPGDLWILGEHRLLCGDSTKAEHVKRLMDGAKADAMVTDPPFGISYRSNMSGELPRSIEGDNDTRARDHALSMFQNDFPVACFATWHCSPPRKPRGMLIWKKNVGGMGDLSFPWSLDYEVIWVFGEGWSGHRGSSVLEGETICTWNTGPARRIHPHQKPVKVISQIIEKSSGLLFDPFLGSGTTLIAAEQLGRKCYGMEISPAYCDVIVKRWETLTGKKAVRVPLEG